ncbi:DUF6701 domain-containing protein [Vibrio tapetis]|uniref:DUF6701 domain-containing protein n=1 Tax=Vibrio tapetis subsp. tapetis TaxID=1671868 RepID=A0A2N8ZK47_9VIBR|nr:DUF6701 domain-containing protein [Vibrio tapetis]SON52288.1 conserved exported protein of unknown function [Vibrio tapetis subsp. tapetis]
MKLATKLLSALLFLVSFSSLALELEYGRYNVNSFPHADCISTVCQIDFEETYATTPAVFFMDTVSFQNEQDAPSAIRILDVTTSYVRFEQQYPPDSRAPNNMEPVPMTVIDYLVIEKGVHDFNGVKVLVGSVNTARYRTRIGNSDSSGNRNNRVRVDYATASSNQITSFSSTPAVLHQVQTVNNPADLWLSTVVPRVTTTNFDVALERLEIDGRQSFANREFPQIAEEIAYLAAVGSGEKDEFKFQIRNQQTTSSLNSNQPVTQGCETFATYTQLDVVPVIIGKMNSRAGNNGGFIRRCRLETARSSFMVDEDQDFDSERRHVAERIGFILFEVPFEVNQCTQFTGAAQTWDTDGEMVLQGDATITGTVPNGRVGFDILTQPNWLPTFCDGVTCVADPSLKVPLYDFSGFTFGGSFINAQNGDVLVPGQYSEIKVTGNKTVTFSAGDYFMEDFIVGGGATVLVSGEVRIHAKKMDISGNSKVNYSENGNIALPDAPDVTTTPEQLYLISYGIDSNVDYLNLNNNNSVENGVYISGSAKVGGFVLSESLTDINGGSSIVYGAVASLYLKMYGSGELHGDISSCNDATQQMQISPTSGSELIDNAIPITFSIVNSQGNVDTSLFGNFNLTHDGGANVCWKPSAAGACYTDSTSLPFSAGMATYYLYSSVEAEVDITATWVEKPAITANAGPYKFENNGYIFEPSPLEMIAGQSTTATIKAVDNNGDVLTSYTGAKTLQLTTTSKILPSSGSMDATLETLNVTFVAGESQVTVKYLDAGKVSLSIQEASDGFKGDMVVHSRPHTFAICNITSTGLNQGYAGTATSGNGFAKAGESFSVTIKPVTWLGSAISGDNSGDGNIDEIADLLCSKPTTPNYYTSGGQFARVKLSHALHTPAGKQLGTLNHLNTSDQHYNFTNTSEAQNGLTVSGLSWNEVGSLWLQADYANYALGAVEQGVVVIGRFYPHHFALSSGVVNEGQSNFTYMKQGFGAQFEVAAQSETQLAGGTVKTITQNYEFVSNVMAIELKAVDASKSSPSVNDLTGRIDMSTISGSGWESDWSAGTLGIPISILKFNRVEVSSSPLKTIPDGPYQVQMGLEVSEGSVNCVTQGCTYFDSTDEYRNDGTGAKDLKGITEELDVRYGRMTMSDIGGNSGANLMIPLKAEYWNGSNFVTNTLDSGSAFNSDNFCRLRIWPTSGSTAVTMTGAGSVLVGDSDDLVAVQNQATNDVREQVKLWLRIGAAPAGFESGQTCAGVTTGGLEYLHYNWDGRGDENPRATVTFGVYRGNDRVIYRGEPRMN